MQYLALIEHWYNEHNCEGGLETMKIMHRALLWVCLALVLTLGTASGAAASVIGKDRAKSIALTDAGYIAAQATFIKVKLDKEEGRRVYEVEFYVRDGAILEFDYEIEAYTGTILDRDREAEGHYTVKVIGQGAAKKIALRDAGYAAGQVKFLKAKLDKGDGRYDIEFYCRANPALEHDYEIDAITGAILSHDSDVEGYAPGQDAAKVIGKDKAKSIALGHAGLSAGQVKFTKVKLDREDGRQVYEVEFRLRGKWQLEYDYEIDAKSGAILSWDRDCGD